MSAITGIFYRDGRSVEEEQIKKMNDRLSHRGPDGSAIWCEGPVALGHQMLHTTPESLHEKLPYEEDGLVITADARIDNRKELSEKLGIEDKEEISDSYFILKSYQKWGEKCPEELLGDFAFAIWDKDKEQLFCARDHMGVKPFYYFLCDEFFVFGTEIKALLTLPEVPRKPNELKIAFYLIQVLTDKTLTFYDQIFSLTSAHSLIIGSDNLDKQKYWELNPDLIIKLDSEEEYIKEFRKIFSEAIKCRLRSAFPVGFELSGGLDSSSVVCMAKNISKDSSSNQVDINTYSMVFEDIPETDESYYIKKVVETGGINSNLIPSDKISPLKNMSSSLWYQDQPFITVNMAILSNMYEKMQNDGIRINLGGSGGDAIVSYGTNYFRDLTVTFRWNKLINEIYNVSKRSKHNFFNLFFNLAIVPLLPDNFKRLMKSILNLGENNENFVLSKDFAEKLGGKNYLNTLTFNYMINEIKTAREHHYFMIDQYYHQFILEMVDRLASAYYIESRHPFFDKRLVEFCYAIPTDMKFSLGWNRYVLRASMEDILPKKVQWLFRKKYFDSVIEKNLLLYGEKVLNQIYSPNNLKLRKYIDMDINNIYQSYKRGNNLNLSNLWKVTVFYLWLNEFYDDNS
jgi:asparagine synthase (glutamine-hydrolysing)